MYINIIITYYYYYNHVNTCKIAAHLIRIALLFLNCDESEIEKKSYHNNKRLFVFKKIMSSTVRLVGIFGGNVTQKHRLQHGDDILSYIHIIYINIIYIIK